MRAVVVNQASTGVEVVDHEKPAVVGHGQALVKVEYCGVCHTDLHVAHGDFGQVPGRILGHEGIGIVEEVGEGVEDLKVGDHVVATVEHAQYVVTSELNCTLCPEGVDLKQAAFWNLGHTGMYALRRSNLQLGEPCAVLGQGFVGAITAQCARIAGAVPVIVTDLDNNRLEAAKKMGADVVINSKEDPDGWKREVAKLNRGGTSG